MGDKTKAERLAMKAGAIDELSLQNAIRSRHKQDWPNTILQLTKRIQAVNQTWNKIIWQIMNIPGLSINYSREGVDLHITVTYRCPGKDAIPDEAELHTITVPELMTAGQYIEVLLMDKLDHSPLIARLDAELHGSDAQ